MITFKLTSWSTAPKFLKLTLVTMVLLMLMVSLAPSLTLAVPSAIENRLQGVGDKISTVKTPSLPATLGGIIKVFLSIVGAVFMAYIIYAGYLWLTAAGAEDKIDKAKTIIRGCIIGLIIVLAAYIITATVVNRLIGATNYKTAPAAIPTRPDTSDLPVTEI